MRLSHFPGRRPFEWTNQKLPLAKERKSLAIRVNRCLRGAFQHQLRCPTRRSHGPQADLRRIVNGRSIRRPERPVALLARFGQLGGIVRADGFGEYLQGAVNIRGVCNALSVRPCHIYPRRPARRPADESPFKLYVRLGRKCLSPSAPTWVLMRSLRCSAQAAWAKFTRRSILASTAPLPSKFSIPPGRKTPNAGCVSSGKPGRFQV